jgi:hypothetical protein
MSQFRKYVGDFASEIIVEVIGWFFCISFLVIANGIGRGLAAHFGDANPDMIRLLSALALIWLYEHRNLDAKYDRLRDLLDNRGRPV